MTPPTTMTPPPQPPLPAPEKPAYKAVSEQRSEALLSPLNPETEARIEAMQLGVEGYKAFLANIDTSLMDYARQYPEFDPARNGFRQDRRIEWATVHHTAMWANAGTNDYSQAIGEPDPKVLIDIMGRRGDDEGDNQCCAVQFFNDRNGKMWQFTPRTARVRHDKRYEEISVGLETEGIDEQFTTKQFENIVYWLIATTNAEGLLRERGGELSKIMRGHEEARNEWNDKNPKDKQPIKQDGDAPIMNMIRNKAGGFLTEKPEVIDIPVTIR